MSEFFDLGFEAGSTKVLVDPPTVRQVAFIVSLRKQYESLAQEAHTYAGTTFNPPKWVEPTSKEVASTQIKNGLVAVDVAKAIVEEWRKTAPASAAPAAPVSEGLWIIGEVNDPGSRIFKVLVAVHGSGKLYAKELVEGKFVYVWPAMKTIAKYGRKLSLEEARSYGKLYGVCCSCGRTLTDDDSIANGIGPVCAKKF